MTKLKFCKIIIIIVISVIIFSIIKDDVMNFNNLFGEENDVFDKTILNPQNEPNQKEQDDKPPKENGQNQQSPGQNQPKKEEKEPGLFNPGEIWVAKYLIFLGIVLTYGLGIFMYVEKLKKKIKKF